VKTYQFKYHEYKNWLALDYLDLVDEGWNSAPLGIQINSKLTRNISSIFLLGELLGILANGFELGTKPKFPLVEYSKE